MATAFFWPTSTTSFRRVSTVRRYAEESCDEWDGFGERSAILRLREFNQKP
jgi:hypothetical protein